MKSQARAKAAADLDARPPQQQGRIRRAMAAARRRSQVASLVIPETQSPNSAIESTVPSISNNALQSQDAAGRVGLPWGAQGTQRTHYRGSAGNIVLEGVEDERNFEIGEGSQPAGRGQAKRGNGKQWKGHSVCVDNFFCSPSLFDSLLRRGIYATGTVKGYRVGFPSTLSGFKKGEHPRSTLFWATHASGKMAASIWYDSKPVAFLSTSADPTGPAVARRWLKGKREEIPTTPHQVEYQVNMCGVDLVDQMRKNYSTQLQSKKWWHKYLMFIVDSVLHNAWVCYCHD